jgi:HEAT repeat protein
MLAAYRGGNARTRFVLLSALGRIKSPVISELLIAALDDPEENIRLEAARVLGVRKDERAVPRMLQAVAAGGTFQGFYIRMLAEIGDARAFEPLQALLSEEAPEFMLRREVVMALRKIDNPRAVDLFHEQLESLPSAEADRLAHILAGTDLLNAAGALARKARASGDTETQAQAALAARDALDEHRSRLQAIRNGEGTAEAGSAADGHAEVAGANPHGAISKAGLDVIRKFESILRDLGRDR